MRPNGVVAASFGLVVTGKIHKYVVYGPVAVVVVLGEIHPKTLIGYPDGFNDHFPCPYRHVVSFLVIGPVIGKRS